MNKILVADIGGSNSRFAEFSFDDRGRLALRREKWLPTAGAASFAGLLDAAAESGFDRRAGFDITAIAAPGPVEAGARVVLPNVEWNIDLGELGPEHGPDRMLLINDFEAQAYGCRTEAVKDALVVQPGGVDREAAVAVIGAGTGLGYAALVPDRRGGHAAVPSEAGHAGFPFQGRAEYEYADFLGRGDRAEGVIGDRVVSGPGLASVHEFLTGRRLPPEVVADAIGPESETTAWFARFYARACRNYALTVLARGGVYISGGVAAKNPFLVMNDHFRKEFAALTVYRDLLRRIPVFLNTNQDAGLWGAAHFARLHLSAGGAAPPPPI